MLFSRKAKNLAAASVAFIILFSAVILSPKAVYAADAPDKAYNWYVMRNKNHSLPKAEPEMSFIDGMGGIYCDKEAAEKGDKVIYLTFDAGYENGNVERIVSTLEKHNATGAFFVLKNFIERNPELVKRMASDGMLICNHTLSHPDMTKCASFEKFSEEINGLSDLLSGVAGTGCAKFFRPPEGRFSRRCLEYAEKLGYKTVFWSFAYADWDNNKQPSREYAINKILENVHPGEIMLLHPTSKTNADVLDTVMTRLESDGYRFGSLGDIK